MNRKLKFRVWDKNENLYDNPSLVEVFSSDGILRHLYDYEGEHTVIEQFTGRHDRNGKEIYENDIVERVHDKYRYKVVYDLSDVAYICVDKNGDDVFLADYDFNVIGNIHENPELLVNK